MTTSHTSIWPFGSFALRWTAPLALAALVACAPDPVPAPLATQPAPEARVSVSQNRVLTPEADSAWTIASTHLPSDARDVLVRDVRLGSHVDTAPGYDRITFEFRGAVPEVHIAYVESPVIACGSGKALQPAGEGALEIRLTGARAHTAAGNPTIPHGVQIPSLPAIIETVPTCDFEGTVTWVLGVAAPEAYRVTRLADPARLAVDVRHPQ